MSTLAIIAGSGFEIPKYFREEESKILSTPYGETSGPLIRGKLGEQEIIILPRHGSAHTVPPHKVNYRANLWALHDVGIKNIIAIAAVGCIQAELVPGQLVFPDQIIDYTSAREHTFFDGSQKTITHIDFTKPYCEKLRQSLIEISDSLDLKAYDSGVYGATEGPRLETAAEIDRMEWAGCDIVGMTGMPEASLAKELNLCYATCAVVANYAAGRGGSTITMKEIETNLAVGMKSVQKLLVAVGDRPRF